MPAAKRPAKAAAAPPATKKQKTTTSSSFPAKVSKSGMTLVQLRQEAEHRGLELGNATKFTKDDLLKLLGVGSVSLVALSQKTGATTGGASASTKKKGEKKSTSKESAKGSTAAAKKTTKKGAQEGGSSSASVAATKKPKSTSQTKPMAVKSSTTAVAVPKSKTIKEKPTKQATREPAKAKEKAKSGGKKAETTKPNETVSAAGEKGTDNNSRPRISSKLTLAELKQEVVARQLDPQSTPKLKADLLKHLVDGSIHVFRTKEYQNYQNLLQTVREEKPQLEFASGLKLAEAQARRMDQLEAAQMRRIQLAQQREAEAEALMLEQERQKEEQRQAEIESQKSLHCHLLPRLKHCHKLAKSSELTTHGQPRLDTHLTCDVCKGRHYCAEIEYTCEACNWDICSTCVEWRSKSQEERQRIRKEKERKERERQAEMERREQERQDLWDSSKQFKKAILKPGAANKNVAKPLKFTVWCSDGDEAYGDPPNQEFDSSWKTKKEANDRARYLFFWHNPWGTEPSDVAVDQNHCANRFVDDIPEPNDVRDGMNKWEATPDDSTTWTVGVVPAVAYAHLPYASNSRHSYDEERNYEERDYDYCGLAF